MVRIDKSIMMIFIVYFINVEISKFERGCICLNVYSGLFLLKVLVILLNGCKKDWILIKLISINIKIGILWMFFLFKKVCVNDILKINKKGLIKF